MYMLYGVFHFQAKRLQYAACTGALSCKSLIPLSLDFGFPFLQYFCTLDNIL